MEQKWYSRSQAATFLGVSGSTIDRYRRDGVLTAHRLGEQYRYAKEDLDALLVPEGQLELELSDSQGDQPIAAAVRSLEHRTTNNILRKLDLGKAPSAKPFGKAPAAPQIDLRARYKGREITSLALPLTDDLFPEDDIQSEPRMFTGND